MAFEGYDYEDQAELDADRRRQFQTMLAGLRGARPVLGMGRGTPDEAPQPSAPTAPTPDTSGGGGFYGRMVSPLVPSARNVPVATPTFEPPGGPSTPPFLGTGSVRPARPDVMPTRADFPAKPELSGWKKYLGLGLATLGGSPQLAETILHGQADKAERQYQRADKEWEQEQADKYRAAQTENLLSEARARQTPKPDFGKTPEEMTLHDLMTGGDNGQPRINPGTGKPYSYLEAYQAVKQAGQDVKPEKTPSEKEQDISDYLAANKLPNTATNREKARNVIANRGKQEPGNMLPMYDPQNKQLVGAWDPKSGRTVKAPTGGGTTSQGISEIDKQQQAVQKQIQPYQAVIDESNQAQQLKDAADKGNAEADVGLALTFFKAMRSGTTGGSGIRFTQQENNLIMGARSLWDAMEVRGNKIFANGQPLSKTQRQSILDVIKIYRDAAQRRVNELQGSSNQQSGQSNGGPASGNRPPLSSFEH